MLSVGGVNPYQSFALLALSVCRAYGNDVHMGTAAAAKELCAERKDPKASSIDWKVEPGNLMITFGLACEAKGKEAVTACTFKGQEKGRPIIEVKAGNSGYIAVLQQGGEWHDVYKLNCDGSKGASTEMASDTPLSGMGSTSIFRKKSIASELCSRCGKASKIMWKVASTGTSKSLYSVGFELKCCNDGKNDEVQSCSNGETKVSAGDERTVIDTAFYDRGGSASVSFYLECSATYGASIAGIGH